MDRRMCGGREVMRMGRRGVERKRAHFRGAKGDFGWRVTPFSLPGPRQPRRSLTLLAARWTNTSGQYLIAPLIRPATAPCSY